jgi:ABC-type Fe3+/spermidine/putrescine transport system ATPase subunit
MIELKKISHHYGKSHVLNDLTMQIEDQQLTCLLGSSGSGKTTILRLIAGLEIPQKGEIYMEDKLVTKNNEIVVAPNKRNLGFIFQDLALWPHFTVFKNIAFGLEERKEKNVKEMVFKMLHFFDIEKHADKYPHQLSGGQKQLVAIARSLVLKPKILLMDEPFASLDVKLKRKLLDHINNLKESEELGYKLTIVYVTHDHKEAFEIADKVVVLNEGKIEETGTVEQIKMSKNKFVNYFLEY